ncbi:MAG: hemerythrin domain-containing protein [Betaproteobacteria bacterium]|nr:hemerythrin domain-containing protein [Betaproteobacteria bacterium]MBV9362276.1 hemerythrin domain-containing protein [Betaproteobacteria bacterium]
MKAIQKIREEHRAISAVLHGLKQLARDAQNAGVKPDFAVFRAMIHYIDEFPEQLHHPKEDRYLFPPLAARLPKLQRVIDELRAEHKDGAKLVRELERSLVFFEDRWPLGAAEFLATVDAYAEFHWKHMRKEEQEILPAAEHYFSPGDWDAVDRAFDANRDPIAGIKERDFQALFTRIVSLAPEPVGLGERWKKVS